MSKVTFEMRNDAPHQVFSPSDIPAEERRKPYPEQIRRRLKLHCSVEQSDLMVFDMVGVDVSLANALRRIMLAEVATVAGEHIYIENNTSIIFDEVLAHRLGLVPVDADPDLFDMVLKHKDVQGDGAAMDGDPDQDPNDDIITEQNTIVFRLHKVFEPPAAGKKAAPQEDGRPPTMNVMSGDFEWIPHGNQAVTFPRGIRPLYEDILLAKLRPGQEIALEMHCRKGVGKDHAKYSPVATAAYRLLPHITFKQPVTGEAAHELVAKCPVNVFDIEDVRGVPTAAVARPRDCTMCRECIREAGWSDRVKLERISDHFIFSIEPCSALSARRVLKEAVRVLRAKCEAMLNEVELKGTDAPV